MKAQVIVGRRFVRGRRYLALDETRADDDRLTIEAAARFLELKGKAVYQALQRGLFPGAEKVRFGGNPRDRWLLPRAAVEAFAARRKQK